MSDTGPQETPRLKIKYENDAAGLPIYIGLATPGTGAAASTWQIRKFTYATSVLTDVEFASGSAEFDKVWNDRATYSYS
jgi:hypothetical protein